MKKTQAIEEIHPEFDPNSDDGKLLLEFSEGLEEVVNFGSHVFKWEVENATTGSDENIPIAMMLRNIIELIDSISILIKQSSVDPCKLILRSLLECMFGLEYILEKDTKNRALAFLVCDYHRQLKLLNKLNPNHDSSKEFKNKLSKDKFVDSSEDFEPIPRIENRISDLNDLLESELYIDANSEYKKLVNQRNKNPNWYQLSDGPRNIEHLANYLKRQAFYETIYRICSGAVHGTSIIEGKLTKSLDGMVEYPQIRSVNYAQTITHLTYYLGLITYEIVVTKRIPQKVNEFSEWKKSTMTFNKKLTSGS